MAGVFNFFPVPFPDETLHGVLSRYCRLAGLASFSALKEFNTGKAHFAKATALPCGIDELARLIPASAGLTTEALVFNHTMLSYFRPFLPAPQGTLACSQMAYGTSQGLALRLGIVASTLTRFQRIRYCAECVRTDDERFGQAYWHRVHQLPGVWICPIHRRVLTVADPHWCRSRNGTPFLPDDDAVRRNASMPQIDSQTIPELYHLAVLSESLLNAGLGPLCPESMRKLFLSGCDEKGLCERRRLKLDQLALVSESYFRRLPDEAEFSLLSSASSAVAPEWITKLLRKPRGSHHPMRYLLVMRMLGLRFHDLVTLERSPVVPVPVDHGVVRSEEKNGLEHMVFPAVPFSLRALAAVTGRSVGTVKTEALRRGLAVREFPRELLPHLIDDIRAMATTGASIAEIASRFSLSDASIYRAIRTDTETYGRRSVAKLEHRREQMRQEFLFEVNGGRLPRRCAQYMWLYRNDRQWLSTIIKNRHVKSTHRKPIVDWAKRDIQLSNGVSESVASIIGLPGKPIRVTVAKIGQVLLATDDFEKHLHHLPRCREALLKAKELPSEFLERRLRWALKKSLVDGTGFSTSRLQRLIGLKTRTPEFDRVRSKLIAEYIN